MNRLSIISDSVSRARYIGRQLDGVFDVQVFSPGEISDSKPTEFTFGDVNLDGPRIPDLKLWLQARPENGKIIIAVDKGSHLQAVQAYAIGATDLLSRPIDGQSLLAKLLGGGVASGESRVGASTNDSPGVTNGVKALQNIFGCASSGTPLDSKTIDAAAESIVSDIEDEGFARWLETIRHYHSQTFQHCLIVTGVAVTFAQRLGFSTADQRKMATAGLLHDIGKAKIPIAILEKPGPLDAEELAVMRQHPLLGYESLKAVQDLHPEMLDMVVHHHEYLDGSGYPHGLDANDLSDLVRTMTISDIYGALLEQRSYKPPMSGEAAYRILQGMGPKLDMDLVREFEPISRGQF
jgi:putative nucleotidyltransferase with HDIG domain